MDQLSFIGACVCVAPFAGLGLSDESVPLSILSAQIKAFYVTLQLCSLFWLPSNNNTHTHIQETTGDVTDQISKTLTKFESFQIPYQILSRFYICK